MWLTGMEQTWEHLSDEDREDWLGLVAQMRKQYDGIAIPARDDEDGQAELKWATMVYVVKNPDTVRARRKERESRKG